MHASLSPTHLTVRGLAEIVGAPSCDRTDRVRGATHHSGRVRAGDAFFALPGADHHGIEHADEALAAGAVVVVSDRPHPRGLRVDDPGAALLRLGRWARGRLRAPVVGVTGSAGKTTARALLAAVLDAQASEGNLNTPHALAGRLVRAWSDEPDRPLILELGIDHVGEMDRLTDLVRPDVGLLTRIAAAHLDGLGDEATVAREKARLLHASPRGLAAEDAWRRLPDALAVRIVRYGLDADAPWSGRQVGDPFAPALAVDRPVELHAELPGPGAGLAESALGALAAAEALGVPADLAASRLVHARLEGGRLTPRRGDGFTVLDDSYNANPVSARQALELLRRAPGPRVAILGEMLELGVEAERHHRELGEASRGLERVLFVGRHAEAVRAGNPDVEIVPDDRAVGVVARLPREGTLLVKASRGMRFERLVAALLEAPA
jgi:UDP-N-acetylmuramoyl-tripeptide--D-alanyl-D-alanine ligase